MLYFEYAVKHLIQCTLNNTYNVNLPVFISTHSHSSRVLYIQ